MYKFAWLLLSASIVISACTQNNVLTTVDSLDAGAADASIGCQKGLFAYKTACKPAEAECGAEKRRHGPACEPILDDCEGDQVSIPGGGCIKVGMEECLGGLMGPPNWECSPIGLSMLKPCHAGWKRGNGGWCEPLLPQKICPAGQKAVLGSAECQPIGDCESNASRLNTPTSGAIYVDKAYTGVEDGGLAHPFSSIVKALDKAAAGAKIVVSAGIYSEDVEITKPMVIEGLCAEKVMLKGQGGLEGAMVIKSNQVTVRGITVTGPQIGVLMENGQTLLEEVVIEGCGREGVSVKSGAQLTLRKSLLSENANAGVWVEGGEASLEQTVIRRTRPKEGERGELFTQIDEVASGVAAVASKSQDARLTLTDCLITDNHSVGALLAGGRGVIERTVIRHNLPGPVEKRGGRGIVVLRYLGHEAQVSLRDAIVLNNHQAGVSFLGAVGMVERTLIRDTQPQVADNKLGIGLFITAQDGYPAQVTVVDSQLVHNRTAGLALVGSEAALERVSIQDTQAQLVDLKGGNGVYAQSEKNNPTSISLRECLLSRNTSTALVALGTDAVIERSVIKETAPSPADKTGGMGINASSTGDYPTSLTLRDAVVSDNRSIGIFIHLASATIDRTVVKGTAPRAADNIGGNGIIAQAEGYYNATSTLELRDSLIRDNHTHGIVLYGSKGTIERSAIRDTHPQKSDGMEGEGIVASANDTWNVAKDPALLKIKDSLVTRNRTAGIALQGAEAQMSGVIVRETDSQQKNGTFGYGVFLAAYLGRSSQIEATDSLFLHNRSSGLALWGSSAKMDRCSVRETKPEQADLAFGYGIQLSPTEEQPFGEQPSQLTFDRSVSEGNIGVGIAVRSSHATIQSSVIRDTHTTASGEFGFGIQVERQMDNQSSSITLADSLVTGNAAIGAALFAASGEIRRCIFSSSVIPINLSDGADPKIGARNVLEDNVENEVAYDSPVPSPPPKQPPLPGEEGHHGQDGGGSDGGTGDGGTGDGGPGCVHPFVNKLCKNGWCRIPAGCFTMGSPPNEPCRSSDHGPFDETQHQVTLTHDFEIAATEVTQGQFMALMGYNPAQMSSNNSACAYSCVYSTSDPLCGDLCYCGAADCSEHPVERVSWNEAAAFCNLLSDQANVERCYQCTGQGKDVTCQTAQKFQQENIYLCPGYRLPTEAEWEYSARAGTTTAYCNGPNDPKLCNNWGVVDTNLDAIGWYIANSKQLTHAVAQKSSNAWGLYDMAGNVNEWCHDRRLYYLGKLPVTDPWGSKDGSDRTVRGGSYFELATYSRMAARGGAEPTGRFTNYGFRCARTIFP